MPSASNRRKRSLGSNRFSGPLAVVLLAVMSVARAGDYLADSTGCKVWDPNPAPNETSTWTGSCVDGYISGQGRQQWIVAGQPAGTSEGEFVKGKLEGKGVRTYKDGARYEGSFVDGALSGQGVMTAADGTIYSGGFEKGLRHGRGVLTMRDGQRYEGDFKNNLSDGQGELTFKNGVRMSGTFKANLPDDVAITEADGSKFTGIFVGPGKSDTSAWFTAFSTTLVATLNAAANHPPRGSYVGLLKVTFNSDGSVASWIMQASTGSEALDEFELGQVRSLKNLPAFPHPDQTAIVMLINGLNAWRTTAEPVERPLYAIKEERTGTHLGGNVVKNIAVPPDKSYEELTAYEKQVVKSRYDKMADGDEPPYPIDGTKKLIAGANQLARRYQPEGVLSLVVDIDEHGTPTAVSALQSPGTDFTRAVATLLMVQKYKPAVCSGQPCKMQYPFSINYLGATAIN
jgi:hypothetical protein